MKFQVTYEYGETKTMKTDEVNADMYFETETNHVFKNKFDQTGEIRPTTSGGSLIAVYRKSSVLKIVADVS